MVIRVEAGRVHWVRARQGAWIVTEASNLGWKAGYWPEIVLWIDHNCAGILYRRSHEILWAGEFGGFVYLPAFLDAPELHVLND